MTVLKYKHQRHDIDISLDIIFYFGMFLKSVSRLTNTDGSDLIRCVTQRFHSQLLCYTPSVIPAASTLERFDFMQTVYASGLQ